MSITEKIKRLREGIASESDPDILQSAKAILQGMSNFHLGLNKVKALERFYEHCRGCEFNVPDPVKDMHVEDNQIPDLSKRMCSHCGGCVLSYKIRQSVKKCEFWNE